MNFMKIPFLVSPPHENISNRRYRDHVNRVVNFDLVQTLHKSRKSYYPDNDGIPTIVFSFGEKDRHDWYFDKGEEVLRDEIFDDLTGKTRPKRGPVVRR